MCSCATMEKLLYWTKIFERTPSKITYDCLEDNQGTTLQTVENMEPLSLAQVLCKHEFHLGLKSHVWLPHKLPEIPVK